MAEPNVEPVATEAVVVEPVIEPVAIPQEAVSTVSKKLFDKTSSELAELKRQLKDYQDKGKSAEELAAQRLQELQDEIATKEHKQKELNLKLSKANAMANVAEAKTKINLDKESLKDFDSVFNALVNDDETVTTSNSTSLNKLLLKVYQKGVDDAKLGNLNSHTAGIVTGGSSGATSSIGKQYAEQANQNNLGKTDIFTKYSNNKQ